MKHTTLLLLILLSAVSLSAQKSLISGGVRVKIVNSFADYKVQVVNNFPDVDIRLTGTTPSAYEWQIVDSHPDFTVQYVSSFADYKVRFVNSFPGLPAGSSPSKNKQVHLFKQQTVAPQSSNE